MENTKDHLYSAEQDLAQEIYLLRTHLQKTNSAKRRFLMGIVTALGGVVGASILAAPFIYIISKLLHLFGVDAGA